jgi:hypothetical protein
VKKLHPRNTSGVAWIVSACLVLGCVGEIGGASGRPDRGASNEAANGGRSGGQGGSPGSPSDPGRITVRRLNRTEYNNTVRDLLGTSQRPADLFPDDPSGFGFDNNGDVQSLTTIQIDQYQSAAEALVVEVTAAGAQSIVAAAQAPGCDPVAGGADASCVRKVLTGFIRRAWRRPPGADEVDRVMGVARAAQARGEDLLSQLRAALIAVLSAPQFLFRIELDPDPLSVAAHPLGDYELASRLSYLIYRSMPDEALFAAAEAQRLRTDAGVRDQTLRMLADPKGAGLVEGFAGQWLDLDDLPAHQVDPVQYGAVFDAQLALAMRAETMRFFSEFLRENLPASGLLDARFTFVDQRLAKLYGLPAPPPGSATRVALSGDQRAGIITQASVLTATSMPNRTSPVARGAWVLAHLLCAPPPPPPPDVPPLPDTDTMAPASARALLEAHRRSPACSGCHDLIDPIGLGLENYDAIGRWRTSDAGAAIDPSGSLPDGSRFKGAVELSLLLAKDPRVPRCLTASFFTYATSRHPGDGTPDGAEVDRIVGAADRGGGARLGDLVLAMVTSNSFRRRRGELKGAQP